VTHEAIFIAIWPGTNVLGLTGLFKKKRKNYFWSKKMCCYVLYFPTVWKEKKITFQKEKDMLKICK
jgi:hypothetical protein